MGGTLCTLQIWCVWEAFLSHPFGSTPHRSSVSTGMYAPYGGRGTTVQSRRFVRTVQCTVSTLYSQYHRGLSPPPTRPRSKFPLEGKGSWGSHLWLHGIHRAIKSRTVRTLLYTHSSTVQLRIVQYLVVLGNSAVVPQTYVKRHA